MKTYKIPRMTPGRTPGHSARIFNERKVKALEETYNEGLPRWYTWISKKIPILGKLAIVNIEYVSPNKEVVKITLFGKAREEIVFIYF